MATAKKKINPNMELWDSVCKTDPDNTKSFKGKGGFQGTAICAQSQRKRATELWGSFGDKWGVRSESFKLAEISQDPHDSLLVYRGELYYPLPTLEETMAGGGIDREGSFSIFSEIEVFSYNNTYKNWKRNNDIHKKVRTDALTKGLSELGFNADIFLGFYDDNKYIQELRDEKTAEAAAEAQEEQDAELAPMVERYRAGFSALQKALDMSVMQTIQHLEETAGYPRDREEDNWTLEDFKRALIIIIDEYRKTQKQEDPEND